VAELHRLLPEADHLVITTPLTRETEGLIGERELALSKQGAFVYNIGRGRIIDEGALTRALQSGHLGGAGLDVFGEEPLPADSPLWDMENVIVTCHYAGLTPRYAARCWGIFMDNLRRFVSGEPLANIVDPELGY
jgi:phosphoglycerate dehydrogenase-like enzyme